MPLFSRVRRIGDKIRIGYLIHALYGAHKWVELLCTPCVVGDPRRGDQIKSGYPSPIFPGAHKWVELLHTPSFLQGYPTKGTKTQLATSPLPFPGPKIGRNCYVTPAF